MNMRSELQNAILKVAKEIHVICQDHGIKYFMLGGTFLGAIRHKGFIPWDDDIDFGMTIPEYKKFIEVVKTMDHPWLDFDIPSVENVEYNKAFIKVYDRNTTLLEEQRQKIDARGVFVDIFPVGYAGNTYEDAVSYWNSFQFLRALLDRKKYTLHTGFHPKDMLLRILSHMFTRRYLMNRMLSYIEREISRKDYSILFDGFRNEITRSQYYDDPLRLYDFEDTQFYGISDYHGYLTDVFHDYMQLPPEDKRVGVHVKYLDLNLPYKEYLKSL